MGTPLSDKMRALADTGHVRAEELRKAANQLDEKVTLHGLSIGAIGAWARARKLWSDVTGEPLV
jgi:surfactin synthase thioesterase subunit